MKCYRDKCNLYNYNACIDKINYKDNSTQTNIDMNNCHNYLECNITKNVISECKNCINSKDGCGTNNNINSDTIVSQNNDTHSNDLFRM